MYKKILKTYLEHLNHFNSKSLHKKNVMIKQKQITVKNTDTRSECSVIS